MFFLSRCFGPSYSRNLRRYALAAPKSPTPRTFDTIQKLEQDHAQLLRVFESRVVERTSLLSQLSEEMSAPEDIVRLKKIKESAPLQVAWDDWIRARQLLDETMPLLSDPDPIMRSLASEESARLTETLAQSLQTTLPSLLIPSSTTAQLGALMELKSGVGGSESSLFLSELLRMYQRYAHVSNWKAQVVALNETENGGTKDAIVEFKGEGSYDALRWESGVHRVQRVPTTDSGARIHTSTVAIVVLPLVEEVDSQAEDLFSMDEVRIEVMRARGAGGQHVNKTESAVRLTHIPTGITVSMQDERSQHQNRRSAFKVLRSRLMDQKITRDMAARRASRKSLVQTADRSEKIRTYNYAQDRVTDHRIGLTMMNLASVLEGDGLMHFIEALKRSHKESLMNDMLDIE